MRSQIILILTIVLSLYTNVVSFGQSISESKGPPSPNTNGPVPNQLPIDDDIYILLAMGLLLGLYFLLKKYRSNDIPA